MNKLMILAILIAYKAVNDKSLSIRVNEGESEYVANNVSDIDYEDIYDNIDDYEYPYNHVNRSNL